MLSKELNHEILEVACLNEKRLYRHAVQDLSEVLRKRPQIILELPRVARHELFRPLLGLPQFDLLAGNLVVNWLRVSGEPMMVAFLDELGIAHDGHGCVEVFPAEVEEQRVAAACGMLYERFDAEQVGLYLRLFAGISGVDWGVERLVRE